MFKIHQKIKKSDTRKPENHYGKYLDTIPQMGAKFMIFLNPSQVWINLRLNWCQSTSCCTKIFHFSSSPNSKWRILKKFCDFGNITWSVKFVRLGSDTVLYLLNYCIWLFLFNLFFNLWWGYVTSSMIEFTAFWVYSWPFFLYRLP